MARPLALSILLSSFFAWAGPAESKQAQAHVKEGERLYQAGKYTEAAEALKAAQALEPQPRLVYNIARAYDQAGELKLALAYYQQYVTSKDGTDSTLLKRSSLSIDRLRALVEKDEAAAREKAQLEAARTQAEASAAREAEERQKEQAAAAKQRQQAAEAAAVLAQAESARRGTLKTAALVVGGVGVAALGTGVAFAFLSRGAKSDFDQATTVEDKRRLEGTARSRALIADLGMVAGVAGLVTAVLLYPKGGEPAPAVSLWLGPTGGLAEVQF